MLYFESSKLNGTVTNVPVWYESINKILYTCNSGGIIVSAYQYNVYKECGTSGVMDGFESGLYVVDADWSISGYSEASKTNPWYGSCKVTKATPLLTWLEQTTN